MSKVHPGSTGSALLERVPAEDAFATMMKNKHRRYPSPKDGGGGDRLYPLAKPTANPSFQIAPGDTIFAIGSCFARNVENALLAAGRRVLSREFDLGEIGDSIGADTNFFNKYSIHSILNELRWALDRGSFPGKELLYEVGDGEFADLQLGSARLKFPIDQVLKFRHAYLDAMAQVVEADVVILTLGYVETWYDTTLELYTNVAPTPALAKASPGRFEFRVLRYLEVLSALNEVYETLRRYRTKPLKLLVTVSPVPLASTCRDMDILVANTYSKSVQRAALDEFLLGKQSVDYFPSYEYVTLSEPRAALSNWDYRHVSNSFVNSIMADVLSSYVAS